MKVVTAGALTALLLAAGSTVAAEGPRRPTVTVAEVRPGSAGNSERPHALRSLLAAVARRSSVEVGRKPPAELSVDAPGLFEHPLVFLIGSRPFEPLTDEELDVLRSYLSLGGMIVIDDVSGVRDSEFARTAKRELSRAVGGREFSVVPADHAIYRSFYLLDRAWGRRDVSPELEALVVDGRCVAVFSANDLTGAWSRDEIGQWTHDVDPGGRRQRQLAIRLGVNLLLYALTLDYKEDLVHLPLILERRR